MSSSERTGRNRYASRAGRVERPFAALCFAAALACFASACNRNDLTSGPSLGGSREPEPGETCVPTSGCPCPPKPQDLRVFINEVMVRNESTLEDELGDAPPAWLEVFNPGAEAVDLAAVPLSDTLLDIAKWTFPCTPGSIVAPGGFIVVFLDGKAEELGGLHAGFMPPATGVVRFVLNEGSDIVDADLDQLAVDQSAGRFPDGNSGFNPLESPTPGAANTPPLLPDESEFIRGDASEDNRVNISDVTFILKVLFRGEVMPSCQDRLDADDDGAVTVADSTFLADSLFLDGPAIPFPYPERGFDPSPDDLLCPFES